MQIITFDIKRFAPGATSLKDVEIFIRQHKDDRNDLIVEINPAGGRRLRGAFRERRLYREARLRIETKPRMFQVFYVFGIDADFVL
jgi:hypothetical protein